MTDAQQAAREFHEVYERLAPTFGYETRIGTREFDPDSPNGMLMVAVCAEVIAEREQDARAEGYAAGIEAVRLIVEGPLPLLKGALGELGTVEAILEASRALLPGGDK